MAGPTTQQLSDRLDKHIETVHKLEVAIRALEERLDNVLRNQERQDETDTKLSDSLSKTITQQELLGARCATLEKAQEETKKSLEERDRKLWALWVVVVAGFLALVGNLAVVLIRK